jgi:hypothetical protein
MPRARTSRTIRRRRTRGADVSAESLGAPLARLLVFAALALAGSYLLRIEDPRRPIGATAVILFLGMLLFSASLRLRRRARLRRPCDAPTR